MIQEIILTNQQIRQIEDKIVEAARKFVYNIDVEPIKKNPVVLYEDMYEQSECVADLHDIEVIVMDAVNDVMLDVDQIADGFQYDKYEYPYYNEDVILFEQRVSELLPENWFLIYRDYDVYVMQAWSTIDDVQDTGYAHLVKE
jgi:hypothetical protein